MARREALGGSSGIGGFARRPDDRIRDDIRDALLAQHGIAAGNVEVAVDGGRVTLTGAVPSPDDRRGVEEVARAVLGVRDIDNRIAVHEELDQAAEVRPTRPV